MKIKYSGPPFHHFKVGIILPGVQEIEDEWAQRLIEAGIVQEVEARLIAPSEGLINQTPTEGQEQAGTGETDLSACDAQAGQWVEGLAEPVAEDVLEEAEKTAPEPKRRKGK